MVTAERGGRLGGEGPGARRPRGSRAENRAPGIRDCAGAAALSMAGLAALQVGPRRGGSELLLRALRLAEAEIRPRSRRPGPTFLRTRKYLNTYPTRISQFFPLAASLQDRRAVYVCRPKHMGSTLTSTMKFSFRQLLTALTLVLLGASVTGCASINERASAAMGDYIPQWAGGLPADAPPRPGTAKYDEWMKERERLRQLPADQRPSAPQAQGSTSSTANKPFARSASPTASKPSSSTTSSKPTSSKSSTSTTSNPSTPSGLDPVH